MKKIIFITLAVIIVIMISAAAYFFWPTPSKYGPPPPPKDLSGVIVPPVEFPLKNKVFTVPNTDNISVTLTLNAPSARRDYPMGRYDMGDGITRGTLVALDDLTTDNINGRRAVPIAVNQGGSGEYFYLAIMDEVNGDITHATSVPLGDRIKIKDVSHDGNNITVKYLVHDRNQAMVELPRVETSAVIDINTGEVLQAGRHPQSEAVIEAKTFSGTYIWEKTEYDDGSTVVPEKPSEYTLRFNANRIELGTDCNSGSAVFSATAGSSTDFTVEAIATTKMFCDSSQETDYFNMIGKITSYIESGDGSLVFDLNDPAGTIYFRAKERSLEYGSRDDQEADQ